jgi:osmotically-inducible protein OsmY
MPTVLDAPPQETTADSLHQKVSAALQTSPHLQAKNLRFEAYEGRITLQGQVSTWYQKQMAQETLLRLDGVHRVENQLEVCWS